MLKMRKTLAIPPPAWRRLQQRRYADGEKMATSTTPSAQTPLTPFDISTRRSPLVTSSKTIDPFTRVTPPAANNVDAVFDNAKNSFLKLEYSETIPLSDEQRKAVSFEDVPGPAILRYISKIWNYIPIFGNQVTTSTLQYVLNAGKMFGSQLTWGNNFSLFRYLLNEYGPIVRLHGPFGGDVVILSRPEHAKIVFDNDGSYPIRSSLDCVEKYRLSYRQYKQPGPFGMHGPEWEVMRKAIEPALKYTLDQKYEKIASTCDDFVERILAIRNRQQEVPATFNSEMSKWCLECLCTIMFNQKMGFLDTRGLSSASETAVLLESLVDATAAIRKCEVGLHLWKFYETPSWKKLAQNCDTIDHIYGNYLRKCQENLRDRKSHPVSVQNPLSLVEHFLLKDDLNADDILTILLDMTLLGANMTSHTAGFLMYHLARNPRVQYTLYKEIEKLPDRVERSHLQNLPYLRACLTESLRLKPPMPVLTRILSKDITIHGYKIPQGTFMLIATNLSSLREEHFEDALKFKPERWLDTETGSHFESLAALPFGHGPKACLAKDLAEVQIYYLMIKILRKFRIEHHYGDIESNNKLLASPSRPFKFRFVER